MRERERRKVNAGCVACIDIDRALPEALSQANFNRRGKQMRRSAIGKFLGAACVIWFSAGVVLAGEISTAPKPDDNLNAVLWDQTAVEAQATMAEAYILARIRLDEALADQTWTAAPAEQPSDFADKPPAVILDVDDTILNTSPYQAWNVKAGTRFTAGTWTQYVNS